MRRDFSEAARQELLSLVKQVEDEKWNDFTDWFGDRWYDFEGWIGQLDIKNYIDNVNAYHKKVIDKNNTNEDKIEEIFVDVNNHSDNYRGRFLAILTNLQLYRKNLSLIANVISPGNGNFNPEYIGNGLKNAINTYLENSSLLQKMAGDGLNKDTLDDVENQDQLEKLLDAMGSTFIALMPNIGVGQKVEIPIGPDLKFYYAVEGKFDGNTNIDINAVIEDQKVKLGDVSVESDGILKVGVSHSADGENSISVGSENANVKFNIDNSMLEGSGSVVVGNNTYTVTVTVSAESLQLEKSVSTQLEGGSVTSKVGIIKSNNENWKPVPVPVPIEVPYPGVIPEFDIDWETVGEVAVIGAVVYAGIYIGVAIYTGGGSIVVLPPPIPV